MLWPWVLLNLKIGALSFGGAGRILLYQQAVVDKKKWLAEEEFHEILTLAQLFPGPNLVNIAAYLGYRLAGRLGAILGVAALAVPGSLLILGVIWWLPLNNPWVRWTFEGFSIGSVVVFSYFAFRLASGLRTTKAGDQTIVLPHNSKKLWARGAITLGVSCASVLGWPLSHILLGGLLLGALVEWAPNKKTA